MSAHITIPKFKHNYKYRSETREIHVQIQTCCTKQYGDINMQLADTMMSVIEIETEMTGIYKNPVNQPIYLN